MRYVIAATVVCLLVACGSLPPPSTGGGCSSRSQCEIDAYANAR